MARRKPVITLRPATLDDADLLLRWRNDPQTRSASRNRHKVRRNDHMRWLKESLHCQGRRLLIAEEDGMPVGTVRADLSGGLLELSWTVAPGARGHGVAKNMVALLARQIPGPICAEVRVDNMASARVAEYAGMKLVAESKGILRYERGPLE